LGDHTGFLFSGERHLGVDPSELYYLDFRARILQKRSTKA
jgi:hypothetical protein